MPPLQKASPPLVTYLRVLRTFAYSQYPGATSFRQQHEPADLPSQSIPRQPKHKWLFLTYTTARRPPQPHSSHLPPATPLPPHHALRSSSRPSTSIPRLPEQRLRQRPHVRSSRRKIRLDRKHVGGAAGRDEGLDRAVAQRVGI